MPPTFDIHNNKVAAYLLPACLNDSYIAYVYIFQFTSMKPYRDKMSIAATKKNAIHFLYQKQNPQLTPMWAIV